MEIINKIIGLIYLIIIIFYNEKNLKKANICSHFYRKEATVTEAKICGSCAECGDILREGDTAYLLGERLYCPPCVRGSLIAVGIFPVIPPGESRKNETIRAEAQEKRLYFKERRRD